MTMNYICVAPGKRLSLYLRKYLTNKVVLGTIVNFKWVHSINSRHNVEEVHSKADFDNCRVTITFHSIHFDLNNHIAT